MLTVSQIAALSAAVIAVGFTGRYRVIGTILVIYVFQTQSLELSQFVVFGIGITILFTAMNGVQTMLGIGDTLNEGAYRDESN